MREFQGLPDNARLWIYGFERPLDDRTAGIVSEQLGGFIPGWVSHGTPVRGAYAIQQGRFLLLAAACPQGISGCAIDSSIANLKILRDIHGVDGLNRDLVFFRSAEGSIESLDRAAFQQEVDSGRIGPNTPVFDTTIETVGDLRAGRFEKPFGDSWHARAFTPQSVRRGTEPC
jgi:hypothetical protein